MESVVETTQLSIFIQVVTGIIGLIGLRTTVPQKYETLKHILFIETLVQFVELGFYIFLLRYTLPNEMAAMRYFDWMITTPTMLFTMAVYFRYLHIGNFSLSEFASQEKSKLTTLVICNAFMLLFGYLGENGSIDKATSMVFGTASFLAAFSTLYTYAKRSTKARQLWRFVFVIWALYGVAALFDPITKNNAYNILDLFSKNFFGLYIYNEISQLAYNQTN
ncbi:hypothetical protein EB118_07225 [bacterium]|nr:hypothetical protein [bacterium]NDC94444.1 hypothetical protein [bacterium]NDD84017.1 hypothetical protein [bacterium]NDG29873.1 hypothetical protein [bacterium]